MGKKTLALLSTLVLCLHIMASDFMFLKFKDGNIVKYKVESIEEAYFDWIEEIPAVDTSDTPLKFVILSDSTAELVKGEYSKLDSINIPAKVRIEGKEYDVTSIGDNAFFYCEKLVKVTIPSSVTNIGRSAFMLCSELQSIDIPSSVTKISNTSFNFCSKLKSINVSADNKTYSSYDGALYNKEKTLLILVPSGKEGDFEFLSSVDSIGSLAFFNCNRLNSIDVPSSVTTIADSTFFSCGGVKSITVSESVTSIGDCAFYGCGSLTSITIPESVTKIGVRAFYSCNKLDVRVDNKRKNVELGKDAFFYCKSVLFENNDLYLIDSTATKLWFVRSSDSIVELYKRGGVTYSDLGLDTAIIPSNVMIQGKVYEVASIANGAFSECSTLVSVIIPSTITFIDNYTFSGCSNLQNVEFPEYLTSIGYYAFNGCSSLKKIDIPEDVTSIGYYAFEGCSSLESVVIPEKVDSIYNNAFDGCTSLKEMTIPASVTSIGNSAFKGCENLEVTIDNTKENVKIGEDAFDGVKSVTWLK